MKFFQGLVAASAASIAVMTLAHDAFWPAWTIGMLVYLAVNPLRLLQGDK